jgi:hypothetical protein
MKKFFMSEGFIYLMLNLIFGLTFLYLAIIARSVNMMVLGYFMSGVFLFVGYVVGKDVIKGE